VGLRIIGPWPRYVSVTAPEKTRWDAKRNRHELGSIFVFGSAVMMRLVCYPTLDNPPQLRPASTKRDWMNESAGRYAYRCLPLVIANSHGWELVLDRSFLATWTGGVEAEALTIAFEGDGRSPLPASHFGQGVLTFQVGYLFETEELYNLWVMGPINTRKDGAVPLCGVVETDWAPYTFTMNWLFTRPGSVRFDQGEPFCHFFPVPRHLLRDFEPEIHDLATLPEKAGDFGAWLTAREAAVERRRKGELERPSDVWSMNYFRGKTPGGEVTAKEHESRLMVKPFADRRSGAALSRVEAALREGSDPNEPTREAE